MKADRDTVQLLLRAYLEEYPGNGVDDFVDWILCQSGALERVPGFGNDQVVSWYRERAARRARLFAIDPASPLWRSGGDQPLIRRWRRRGK